MIWWTEKDMIYLSPMIKLEYLKKIRVRWIILAIFLVAIWIVMGNPRLGEWYSRSIYPWVSGMLSRFSCLFPFSVGDCFIYGSIAGLLGYLSYAIIRRRRIGRTIRHVVEYLAWVYVWFYIAWGLNYFREDFFTRTRTTYVPFSSEHFQSFLDAYTDSLNASWVPIETIDREVVKEAVLDGYRKLPTRFGLITPGAYLHPKTMLLSRLMSGVGVMGYMGPFFTEFNLNMLVELSPTWDGRNKNVAYMECFGRLMAGLAPWISLPDDDTAEGVQRKQLREWALKSYAQAVDPESPDYLLWRKEGQTLVDAAYIAESFIRGYDALFGLLAEIRCFERGKQAFGTGFQS